jgi:tRNA (cytidine/uridine-2'-O-)-methyltransferase
MLSTKGRRGVFQTEFASGDHFMFGKESEGLSQTILATDPDRVLTLPMVPGERSLNLSNAASVVAYEAVRQSLVLGIASVDAGGRLGWTNP